MVSERRLLRGIRQRLLRPKRVSRVVGGHNTLGSIAPRPWPAFDGAGRFPNRSPGTGATAVGVQGHPIPLTRVPEPAIMLLFGIGLIGLAGVRKKFKKATKHIIDLFAERQGHSALPFLFISFGNHQLPDHLAIEG